MREINLSKLVQPTEEDELVKRAKLIQSKVNSLNEHKQLDFFKNVAQLQWERDGYKAYIEEELKTINSKEASL